MYLPKGIILLSDIVKYASLVNVLLFNLIIRLLGAAG